MCVSLYFSGCTDTKHALKIIPNMGTKAQSHTVAVRGAARVTCVNCARGCYLTAAEIPTDRMNRRRPIPLSVTETGSDFYGKAED